MESVSPLPDQRTVERKSDFFMGNDTAKKIKTNNPSTDPTTPKIDYSKYKRPKTLKEMIQEATEGSVKEPKSVEEFRQIRLNDTGVIVITDTTFGSRAHIPNCRKVTSENFSEKVIMNKNRNGRYYWVDDLATAIRVLKAVRCPECRPKR